MHNCASLFGFYDINGEKKPKSVCNIKQACKDMQRNPIYLTDSYHDHIIDKIKHRDTI